MISYLHELLGARTFELIKELETQIRYTIKRNIEMSKCVLSRFAIIGMTNI